MKTVHGEAAYRNKKHKGLNSAKHQNGYNKLCSSLITTTATVHQASGDSNGAMGRAANAVSHYTNGLTSVKSEFNGSSNSGIDNQLSPSGHHQHPVQMDTAGLIGRGLVPTLNSMNSYLNGAGASASAPERHLSNSGQFASGLSNHHTSSKLEHSSNLIANSSYNQPASLASSSSHLTPTTTKNEPAQFNDLNNYNYYNSTYGGQLLDNNHNRHPHQPRRANNAKDDHLTGAAKQHPNQHHHQNQSTNWTPGQLTSSFSEHSNQSFNHRDQLINNPFDTVQPDTGSSLMPPPATNQPSTMHSSFHQTANQLGSAKNRTLTQCLQTDDEGIGSESGTNCTEEEDDEPSQRIMNGMQHYSAPNGDGSLLVMTQHHQPLSRANLKGSRPSLKNRFKNGIKSWIPTIFHKSSTNNGSCTQYETAYTPVDQQPPSELSTLNCSSNYQPANNSNCSSRQSGKKKTKEGGLKVPFLTKSRKNKSYEEQVAKEECVKETAIASSPPTGNQQAALEECDQLDQLDLPDEVMQYLKENKVTQQQQAQSDLPAEPRSPNSMIVSQLSPSVAQTDCIPKMAQLNSLAIQQPFSPMSVNSPHTPSANNPLSPMQTDLPNNLPNSNNLNDSTVNKPPPSYTFATQQLNQQQQQQTQLNQVDRCNNAFANESSSNSYLNQSAYSSSCNQSNNYNSYSQQINHSTTSNYYAQNYANGAPNSGDPYDQMKQQTAHTINNGCVGATSKIQRYVNNQNINIYLNGGHNQNGGSSSSAGMMPPFYNCNSAGYTPSNCNSYTNWHQPAGHQQMHSMQSQSRQSAMSIDTNNNSSSYGYQSNSLMPPPPPPSITYTQQLSSQLTPPVPSSLLMMNQGQPLTNEMCRPMSAAMNGRCESRCDSRSRLMSPMQICNEPLTGSNMVINDMTSGLNSLAEENLILKMRLN